MLIPIDSKPAPEQYCIRPTKIKTERQQLVQDVVQALWRAPKAAQEGQKWPRRGSGEQSRSPEPDEKAEA